MASLELKQILDNLSKGTMTSQSLVTYYLKRIQDHDIHYNAIAYINPFALSEAKRLDELRLKGTILSPLHGVPILIKDNIDCKDMPNTANSYLLKDYIPKEDAPIIKDLKEAGLVILGKTNLSEWAYFMSDQNMPSGYGSLHGQVKHPYRDDIDPLGSSTGSAVAVALDFAPLAIGTETNGSLIAPAYQCNIVSMRPTFSLLSNVGIIPISPTQDTPGPMGRQVYDVSLLMQVLSDKYQQSIDSQTKKTYKIGIIASHNIKVTDEVKNIYEEFKNVMTKDGHEVIDANIDYKPTRNDVTLYYEMKSSIETFFKNRDLPFLKNLTDIINLNTQYKERTLKYGQTLLERSNETSGDLKDINYVSLRENLLKQASIFNETLHTLDLDALVSIHWFSESPIFGQPSIVVPAKSILDKYPKSLVFIGKPYEESVLCDIANIYELATQKRKDPIVK